MPANPLLSPQQALLVSGIANSFFFGVLTVQVYNHYLAFPQESLQLRFVVNAIYLLQTFEAIVVYYRDYLQLALAGTSSTADMAGKTSGIELVITAVTMSTVQFYYANSIRLVSKKLIFSWLIICCSILQLQAGIALAVMTFRQVNSPSSGRVARYESLIWHFANAVCDVMIAACMTYYLMRYYSHTQRTQRIIKRVVWWMVKTGTVITIVTLGCSSLFFSAQNHSNFNTIYTSIIGALYSNSLLALVNGRVVYRVRVDRPPSALAFVRPMVPQSEDELSVFDVRKNSAEGLPL
ncbi:hypothetical protein CPB83DRAFT_909930 [Crepidotus variabilis]|uniref:DUF6534 domain-containing protein n=1 Tax=Crepidotus variabilis TaxID=179855 RepID=A0A9P6E8F0_9AGAR|nr:hypothetical protein CPB83DRAFT_909930 [Crepidotus variabilis]